MINHRKLILLCLCSQIGGYIMAQEVPGKTHLGFSVTPMLSTPVMAAGADTESGTSFSIGVGGDVYFDLSKRIQLLSGLSLQNTSIAYIDYSPLLPQDIVDGVLLPKQSYWDADYSLLFAAIPVNIKYNFGQPENAGRFFLLGGANFQYQLSSGGDIDLISREMLEEQKGPDEAPFDGDDFWISLNAGIGYEFNLGKGKCSISPVYNYTLTKLYPEENPIVANGQVSSFGLRLAYY